MAYKVLTFAEARMPEYKESRGHGWINYGIKNDYPLYLLELFNKSPKHNAIIGGKVHYINGNGWAGSDKQWIDRVNRSESMEEFSRKVIMDYEIFGGAYIEVIYDGAGRVAELWHVDYAKVRTNADNTQFWIKNDWSVSSEVPTVRAKFNPAVTTDPQIFYLKEYRPNEKAYSLPSYIGALNYIESDIAVSKHVLGNAKNGFAASKMITMVDGEPTEDEEKDLFKRFKDTYTGSDGLKFMLTFVQSADRKPIIDDLGQSDLTREDFSRIDDLIQTNIFSGHKVTTPIIFGVAIAGKLGNRTEMRDGYEIFKNTYVSARQHQIESFINLMAGYAGKPADFQIIPTEPVGIEFSEATIVSLAPKEWVLEKLGIDLSKYPSAVAPAAEQAQASVNDNLKNLTGRQYQQVMRVIRQYSQGKITKEVAVTMLKGGLGLSDEQINMMLGIDDDPETDDQVFNDQEDFSLFMEFGEDASGFEVMRSRAAFADEIQMFADFNKLQVDVLGLIQKDKRITAEAIAEILGIEVGEVKKAITNLENRGLLTKTVTKVGEDEIPERQLSKPLSELETELTPINEGFLIRYSYEWRDGFNNSDIVNSRPFCKALLNNRMYSRSDIEKMSGRLGYSVWDRGGGFWGKQAHCRHEWKANLVKRKK